MHSTYTQPQALQRNAPGLSVTALVRAMAAVAARLRTAQKVRRDARRLLDLEDRMLTDIGFDRDDLERALRSRWYEGPSQRLERSDRMLGHSG